MEYTTAYVPVLSKESPCQSGDSRARTPGWAAQYPRRRLALLQGQLLALSLVAGPNCLLVNRGSQSPTTLVLAVAGVLLLYMGLHFLMGRLSAGASGADESRAPALMRFLGGVLAGVVIFLA